MLTGSRRRHRIAVTGSAGVGKTSLGLRMAEMLEVPFIAEGMRARLEAGLQLHDLGRDGCRALLRELFAQALRQQRTALRTAGGFVADRCPLDFAAFWLYYGFGVDAAATARVFTRARAALEVYDAVFVLPWGVIPLTADGVRSANPWLQLHYQALLEGLLVRWVPATNVIHVPADVPGLDERVAWIAARLNRDAG